MNFNRTLISTLTAVALVATAGFAQAQAQAPSGTMPGAPGETNKQGTAQMKIPTTPAVKAQPQMQAQPAASTTSTVSTDNSTARADTSTPVQRTKAVRTARADRN